MLVSPVRSEWERSCRCEPHTKPSKEKKGLPGGVFIHKAGDQAPVLPFFLISVWDLDLRQPAIYTTIIWLECPNKTPRTWSLLLKLSHFKQNTYQVRCWKPGSTPLAKPEPVWFFPLKLVNMVIRAGRSSTLGTESANSVLSLFLVVK